MESPRNDGIDAALREFPESRFSPRDDPKKRERESATKIEEFTTSKQIFAGETVFSR